MKFLVTGAAGFIGTNVSERLLAAGHQIGGIDNLNDSYEVSLKGYWPAFLYGVWFLSPSGFGAVQTH